MSFQQGLSGLNAAQANLSSIGNNVANAQTIGYKQSRIEFADVYANSLAGGAGPQIGIGVQVAAVAQQFTQGGIATSNNPLDVAINGGGFFRVEHNGAVSYSRNGQFKRDSDGFLVTNSGARLTGYGVDASGQIVASTPQPLQLSNGNIAPRATTDAKIGLNLDSRAEAIDRTARPFDIKDPKSYTSSTAVTVYDEQGNSHSLTLYMGKTAGNTWDVHAAVDGVEISGTTPPTPAGNLTFNNDGTLAGGSPLNFAITGAGVAGTITFPVSLADTTQYGANFAVSKLTQDGFTTGQLSGYSISPDGTVLGRYTNGQTRAQGQIALADFENPQGLVNLGGNLWAESSESGQPRVAAPKSGTLGELKAGALEESNVDLTEELVKMISAQRVYQANAQTITVQDQLMQTLVNIR